MTRTMNTTTHAWAEMRRVERHRRVQSWREARPVVARVRKIQFGVARGCWSVRCEHGAGTWTATYRPDEHALAVLVAHRWAGPVGQRIRRGYDEEDA